MSALKEWRAESESGMTCCGYDTNSPNGPGCTGVANGMMARQHGDAGFTGDVRCADCVGKILAPLALNVAPSDEGGADDSDDGELTLREWLDAQPTREAWLMERLYMDLAPIFEAAGLTMPPVRISCGWTGTGHEGCTLGVCYDTSMSKARVHEIFVSPAIEDSAEVLAVLMHELAHAVAGTKAAHGPDYGKVCSLVGLTKANRDGKGQWPEQAFAGDALMQTLRAIVANCDAYPHASLEPLPPPPPQVVTVDSGQAAQPTPSAKPQGTRLLKAECGECGYVVRITMKWATRGLPACPVCSPLPIDVNPTHVLRLAADGGAS